MASAQATFWLDQTGAAMRERLDLIQDGEEMTVEEKRGARIMLLTVLPDLLATEKIHEHNMCLRGILSAWLGFLNEA